MLCSLEGKTHRKPPVSWVVRRERCPFVLMRAKQLLAKRLSERGYGPATAVLSAFATADALLASVPPPLAASTIRAAAGMISGQAITTLVSAEVAKLIHGVMKTMLLTRLATSLMITAAIGVAGLGIGPLMETLSASGAAGQPAAATQPAKIEPLIVKRERPVEETLKDANGDLLHVAPSRIGTTRLRHGRYVPSVAFSPDGKELASSSYDGTIRFWDPETGKELHRFSKHIKNPGLIAFLTGGKELLVIQANEHDDKGRAETWDVTTGKLLRTLKTDLVRRSEAHRVAVSSRGDQIVFVYDRSVEIVDAQSKRPAMAVAVGGVRRLRTYRCRPMDNGYLLGLCSI